MESLIELILQLFGELLLQLVFEILVEWGLRGVTEPFRRAPHPVVAAIGYAMLGGAAGAISLWPLPDHVITSSFGRLVGLGLLPVLAGLAMTALGAWRRRRDQELLRIDRFACGYLFALAMAFVRFAFGA